MKGRQIALIVIGFMGAADFGYFGLWKGDTVSMFMGILIVAVAGGVAFKERKGSG
jgi:hypothetical protein